MSATARRAPAMPLTTLAARAFHVQRSRAARRSDRARGPGPFHVKRRPMRAGAGRARRASDARTAFHVKRSASGYGASAEVVAGSSGRRRAASIARARRRARARSRTTTASRASRSRAASRASRRRCGATGPSRGTPSRGGPTPGPRPPCGSAAPTRRGRARPDSASERDPAVATSSASTSRSPSTLQVSPRRSVRSPRGAKRSSPRSRAHGRLAVRMVGEVHHEVDAVEREQRADDARDEAAARLAVEHVDLGGARARAHGDLGGARPSSRARRSAAGRRSRRTPGRGRSRPRPAIASGPSRRSPRGPRGTRPGRRRRASAARSAGRRRRATSPGRRVRACASACRCRAATAAGSRTGRARPGTAPTHPACWSRTPGSPSCERQPVRREAKMSA